MDNWIKATNGLPKDGQLVEIKIDTAGSAYARWVKETNAFVGIDGTRYPPTLYFIEWLDESTQADDWLKVLQENLQAQIAGFYNHDKTPAEKKIRNAVIQEYKDLIAIFKHKFPSPPKK